MLSCTTPSTEYHPKLTVHLPYSFVYIYCKPFKAFQKFLEKRILNAVRHLLRFRCPFIIPHTTFDSGFKFFYCITSFLLIIAHTVILDGLYCYIQNRNFYRTTIKFILNCWSVNKCKLVSWLCLQYRVYFS